MCSCLQCCFPSWHHASLLQTSRKRHSSTSPLVSHDPLLRFLKHPSTPSWKPSPHQTTTISQSPAGLPGICSGLYINISKYNNRLMIMAMWAQVERNLRSNMDYFDGCKDHLIRVIDLFHFFIIFFFFLYVNVFILRITPDKHYFAYVNLSIWYTGLKAFLVKLKLLSFSFFLFCFFQYC